MRAAVLLLCLVVPATLSAQEPRFDDPALLFRGHGLITDGRPVGVPLGGLGTGRLDLCADGTFRSATLGPVAEPVPLLGASMMTLSVARGAGEPQAVSLTATDDGAPRASSAPGRRKPSRQVQRLTYRGLFPRAFLRGEDDGLGVDVVVEAFAPLVPHDLEASTWPALGLLVRLSETSGGAARVGFGLALEGDPDLPAPVYVAVEEAAQARVVRDDGPLRVEVDLDAGGEVELLLAVGWRVHDHPAAARFPSARASAEAFLPRARALREAVRAWQGLLFDAGLPRWFAERLCNDLAPLTTNTRVGADGVLATAESGRGMKGITGTIDQRRVSAVVTAAWFPALDLSELEVFAARQAADGAIPHHVDSLFGPLADDEGFLPWPDLACSFALQIAKAWLWTGDRDAVAPLVPVVRRALAWVVARDTDGDGIPEGGSTYDYAHAPDGFVYTASMALAGFAAGERLGRDFGDDELVALATAGAAAAREALLIRLWNGRWFVTAVDGAGREARTSSHLSQLAGEWTARAFGLGALLPEAVVDRALQSLVTRHGARSPWIPPLEVDADGRPGAAPWGWLPYTSSDFVALLIQRGRTDEALATLAGMDAMLVGPAGDPFKVGLYYDPDSGRPSRKGYEWYMSTPASWWSLYALAGFSPDLPRRALTLSPNLPLAVSDARLPLFAPTFTARLHVHDARLGVERRMGLELLALHGDAPVIDVLRTRAPPVAAGAALSLEASLDGVDLPGETSRDGDGLALTLAAPLTLRPGRLLELRLVETASRAVGRAVETAEAASVISLAHDELSVDVRLGPRGVERLVLRDADGRDARLDVGDLFQLVIRTAAGTDLDIRTDDSWSRGVVVREITRRRETGGAAPSLTLGHVVEMPTGGGGERVEVEVTWALVPGQAALRASARVRGDALREAQGVTLRFPRVELVDPGTVGDPLVATVGSRPGEPVVDPVTALDATIDWAPATRRPWFAVAGPNGTFELRGASPLGFQRGVARGDGRGAVRLELHTALAPLGAGPASRAGSSDDPGGPWVEGAAALLILR